MPIPALIHGMVVETTAESFTGEFLYSDYVRGQYEPLNTLACIPVIGIIAGVVRVVVGIFHTLCHLVTAFETRNKGHLYHAGKGCCEILRGVIETIPIVGRVFANLYSGDGGRSWWMIKMYNPKKPDSLDAWMGYWKGFPPAYYVVV